MLDHLPWLAPFDAAWRTGATTAAQVIDGLLRAASSPVPRRIRLGVETRTGVRGSLLGLPCHLEPRVPDGECLSAGTTLAYAGITYGFEGLVGFIAPPAPLFEVDSGPWSGRRTELHLTDLDDQAVVEALAIEAL